MLGWVGVFVACAGATVIGIAKMQGAHGGRLELIGVLFSGFSVLFRSLKVVLQDNLLNPSAYSSTGPSQQEQSPLSPEQAWAVQAPPCFFVSLAYALLVESPGSAWANLTTEVVAMIGCTCVSATFLNLASMRVLQQLGASSMQILGKLNIIVVVSFSVTFLGESLSSLVVVGAALMLVGVGTFEYSRHSELGEQEKNPRKAVRDQSAIDEELEELPSWELPDWEAENLADNSPAKQVSALAPCKLGYGLR